MAAIIEQSHDDKGIIWPLSAAPYQAHLCSLCMDNSVIASASEDVYQKLEEEGIEILYDDRNESPGVKFNDADLLGIPLRLTLSPRTLKKQSIEIKWRAEKEFQLLPLDNIASTVEALLRERANLLK